jgi:hypothetical protein
MPLGAAILALAGLGAMLLSMALVYAVAPQLRSHLRTSNPPVDVPDFDVFAPLQMNRLVWQVLTVRLPETRPRLRTLLVATRLCYVSGPLLIISAMLVGAAHPVQTPHERRPEWAQPPYVVEIPAEPGR